MPAVGVAGAAGLGGELGDGLALGRCPKSGAPIALVLQATPDKKKSSASAAIRGACPIRLVT